MRKRLISILTAVLFMACLPSCSAEKPSGVRSLQKNGGFIYSEEVPWGTGFAEAKEIYADEKLNPESDVFESWRVTESAPGNQSALIPDISADFYGLSWRVELSFMDDALYMASFNTKVSGESFPEQIDTIVHDLYEQFGAGGMEEKELDKLLDDCKGQTVQSYWEGSDGSYLHLLVISQAGSSQDSYSVSIAVCADDTVTPVAGTKQTPDYARMYSGLPGA